MIDTGLNGRVVLITGANDGIGAATAGAFAAQGAAVFLQYLRVPTEGLSGSGGETAPPGEALYRSRRLISADALGRVGQPEDAADVIVFLASAQARWLTGQTLFVGGGSRMI